MSREPGSPRAWLAFVLSVLAGGLGHVYSGRVRRGVLAALALEILLVAASAYGALCVVGPAGLAALTLVAPALGLAIAVDAARCAKSGRLRFGTPGRVVAACLAFALGWGVVGVLLESARIRYLGDSYFVASGAMLPTLQVGDHVFSNALAYRVGDPARGDIVVFVAAREGARIVPADRAAPGLPRESFVKRIVGVPGDTLELQGHVLTVNGERRTSRTPTGAYVDSHGVERRVFAEELGGRRHRVLDDPGRPAFGSGPVEVEDDRYFVAGDDRDRANDSRYWGTVHRDDLLGRTASIYGSWEPGGPGLLTRAPWEWWRLLSARVRWERIGTPTNGG